MRRLEHLLAVGLPVFLVDRVLKEVTWAALADEPFKRAWAIVPDLLYAHPSQNPVGFFGFLTAVPAGARSAVFVGLSLAFMLGLGWVLWRLKPAQSAQSVPLILLLAGALGNTVDRVVHGGVIDCLAVSWTEQAWYGFNLADVAILVGFVYLGVALVRADRAPESA